MALTNILKPRLTDPFHQPTLPITNTSPLRLGGLSKPLPEAGGLGVKRMPRFQDCQVVSLARPLSIEETFMPEGAKGVIMATYADGKAYEVEFDHPIHAVLTVEDKDLA